MRFWTLVLVLALALSGGAARAEHPLDLIQPVRGPIVRHFEPPPTPYTAGHRGIDFAAPEGSPVWASAPGVVAFAGQVGGALYVSIDHEGGLRTTYSFLSSIAVTAGQQVAQGDEIARSGPGHPDEPDPVLHFGLRRGDEYLDPEPYLVASMRRNLWRIVRLAG